MKATSSRPQHLARLATGLAAFALVALVAGCGAGVKLNDTGVEDRTGKPVLAQPPADNAGNQGPATGVTERGVAAVDLGAAGANANGPANVPRVIYFDYDSFAVRSEFQGAMEAHAKFLNANKSRKVALEGHTDERGGREYNLALGQKRSEAVRRALSLLGVADAQVEAVSFGKEKPAATGADEDSLAKNRRAEISYR